MAMKVGRRSSSVIADINVTPMADVMIVLLIIFMVTVPLIGAPVALPEAREAREKKGERIEVIVGSGGEIRAGEERFAGPEAFGDYLALRFEGRPGATILIQADRSSSYSEVAGALDACRRAGTAEIALAARRPISGS